MGEKTGNLGEGCSEGDGAGDGVVMMQVVVW